MNTYFDIETEPMTNFEVPPFDPTTVKLGNLKDPDKVAQKIKEAEEAHLKTVQENAALDARTGFCRMAGFMDKTGVTVYLLDDKHTIEHPGITLRQFQAEDAFLSALYMKVVKTATTGRLIGYYHTEFDLPFLFRRAWIIGVPARCSDLRRGRYWKDGIVDVRDTWTFGDKYQSTGGMDGLAKIMGVQGKSGNGAKFSDMYDKSPNEAIEYLIQDLRTTQLLAERMGEA